MTWNWAWAFTFIANLFSCFNHKISAIFLIFLIMMITSVIRWKIFFFVPLQNIILRVSFCLIWRSTSASSLRSSLHIRIAHVYLFRVSRLITVMVSYHYLVRFIILIFPLSLIWKRMQIFVLKIIIIFSFTYYFDVQFATRELWLIKHR